MTAADLLQILPLIILAAGAILGMLGIAVYRSHVVTFVLTLVALILALLSLRIPMLAQGEYLTALLRFDGYAIFFMGLLLSAAIAVVVMSYGYMRGRLILREEFYLLVLTAMLGCSILVSSTHFVSFFIAFELLSVSLYILIAYSRSTQTDIEAGIKYLIPASTSSAFLLFGMSLVYAHTGTMDLWELARLAAAPWRRSDLLALVGAGMILTGIGFKLALVPFHFWAADVYQGAPAPVTALIATASKGAIFALLLRYFGAMHMRTQGPFLLIFTWAAVFSMFIGNFLALRQTDVKRLLAYSSIAHMGYLLVAFLAGGSMAVTAVTFYLLAYFITTLGAFGVITMMSGKEEDFADIEDYRGLVETHPFLAAVLSAMMFSLAGLPLTAGFLAKFYAVLAGVRSGMWLLVLVLAVNSAIAVFYYLRVIVAVYQPVGPAPDEAGVMHPPQATPSGSLLGTILLALLLLALVAVGVYPGPIIRLIESLTGGLI
jgi:NADH-quinone oxidoreductase subunit N